MTGVPVNGAAVNDVPVSGGPVNGAAVFGLLERLGLVGPRRH